MLKLAPTLNWLQSSTFLRHNFVYFFGSLSVGVLNYLYYPLLGHFMQGEDFGELQTLVSLFLQFTIFLAALSMVTVNIVANHPDKKSRNKLVYELEKMALLITLLVFLVTVVCAPLFKNFLQFHSVWPFIALAAGFVISVPFMFRNAYLRGAQDFFSSSIGNIIGASAKLFFSTLLVYVGLRTFGAISGIILAQFLAFVYTALCARKKGYLAPTDKKMWHFPDLSAIKPQLKYSSFVFLVSLIIILQLSIDIVVIKHYFSPAEAGQYAGVAAMARIIYFLTASIAMVLFSSVRIDQSRMKNRQLLIGSLVLTTIIGGVALVVFTVVPLFALETLFPKYVSYAALLPWLSLAVFLISITNILLSYYMALRQYWISSVALFAALITYILILLNHNSLQQVVTSLLIGSAVMLVGIVAGTVRFALNDVRRA